MAVQIEYVGGHTGKKVGSKDSVSEEEARVLLISGVAVAVKEADAKALGIGLEVGETPHPPKKG